MRDTLTHARKTLMGADLSFGRTVTTGCGKRRERDRTVVGPAGVTCPACRAWGEQDELEHASMADAAARISDGPDQAARFQAIAREHRAAADVWARP